MRHVPWAPERTQDRGGTRDVSRASTALSREGRDRRRRLGILLESGERHPAVRDAGVQGAADGSANLAGGCSGEERRQDQRPRAKGTRGGREYSDGNGDANEQARANQEENTVAESFQFLVLKLQVFGLRFQVFVVLFFVFWVVLFVSRNSEVSGRTRSRNR